MISYKKFSIYGVSGLPRFGEFQGANNFKIEELTPYQENISLYVHIPFCQQGCNFCQLRFGGIVVNSIPQIYIDTLISEISIISKFYYNKIIDSIHFGGGTPSLLNEIQFKGIITSIKNNFNCSDDISVSIEGDADSFINSKLIYALQDNKVKNISIGVQTFDEELRSILGRRDSIENIYLLKDILSKFKQIDLNIDYLYNLPQMSNSVIEKDINIINTLSPHSIDIHPLKYSSCNYNLLKTIFDKKYILPDTQRRIFEFNLLRSNFTDMGYEEIFVGYYSKGNNVNKYLLRLHNLLGGEYIGIGLGARSYYGDYSFSNTFNLKDYYSMINASNIKPISRYVFAPLSDNFITLFPKRGKELHFSDIDISKERDYFYDVLFMLERGEYLKNESKSFKMTTNGYNWYQNMMESLLSISQKKLHIENLRNRAKIFNDFNNFFDSIGSEYV
ncbi:MAG: radical SAM protein [Prevotellaceae bacterium]|jgi:oxygen-independent coproporphyrinogen-3 oxidase|nr:radical SAM protein [Prevotellaceae bacterium]